MNGLEGSGCYKRGDDVNVSSSHWNAWSAELFHCGLLGPFLSRDMRGVMVELNPLMTPW